MAKANKNTKKRLLLIRYEGFPFALRISKVIITLLQCHYSIDILVPSRGDNFTTYSYEDGSPLRQHVNIVNFPLQNNFWWRLKTFVDSSNLVRDEAFREVLGRLIGENNYTAIMVKDSHKLSVVFDILDELNSANIPVICDMHENATAQAADFNFRFASFPRKILTALTGSVFRLKKAEEKYLPRCDRIFVVVDETRRFLLDQYGLNPEKISVVENVVLLQQFDMIDTDKGSSDLFEPDVCVVSYVGSIGPHRGIDTFLKAISLLEPEQKKKAAFVIVGGNDNQKKQIEKRANKLGIRDGLHVLGKVSHVDAIRWIKRSQIGVIPHADTPFIRTTVPNKLFQYMAASALIISSDVGPLGRIVCDTDCGLIFSADSAVEMAKKLGIALSDTLLIAEKGTNGRRAVEKIYHWEKRSVVYTKYFCDRSFD